jgi:LPS export ABC transporter protein LptC
MLKPNKIRQLLALVIVLAGISLVAAILLELYRKKRPAEPLFRLPKNVDVSLQKIHYTETKNGVRKWDLLADKAEYDKGREVTRLTGIRLTVAGNRKTGDISLTADRADYHNKTRDVKLFGNVVARSGAGMEFHTGHAEYNNARSMIRTADRVRFADGNLAVEGVGMELMTDSRSVKILRNVTATVHAGAGKR